jgi:hypothetical protein
MYTTRVVKIERIGYIVDKNPVFFFRGQTMYVYISALISINVRVGLQIVPITMTCFYCQQERWVDTLIVFF